MEKEFVPYEQALALKELGFDGDCCQAYHINGENELSEFYSNPPIVDEWLKKLPFIKAPLWQQAFRWFWNTQGLYVEFFVDDDQTFGFLISRFVEEGRMDYPSKRGYSNPEIAEFNCLKALIEMVKSI